MIVKKPWRYIRIRKNCSIVSDYYGWWLFGVIPIYLVKMSRTLEYCDPDSGKEYKFKEGVYELV